MTTTSIEWTDTTWNPVTGCTKVSAGCKNCYAKGIAERFWGDRKFTDVRCHEDRLEAPLHWRKPRRVFVNSMSDLFHDDVPYEFIDRVFATMAMTPRHTFQILTKRPRRMLDYLTASRGHMRTSRCRIGERCTDDHGWQENEPGDEPFMWPLSNVWLGVSVEDQRAADERIPLLLQTPAAVRFLSCEPLLGPVDLSREMGIHLVIVGGESGPGARPCEVSWIRSIVKQCGAASVPCFVKQLGAKPVARNRWDMSEKVFAGYDALGWSEPDGPMVMRLRDRKGGDLAEWPEDLRVREFPSKENT